ncbi:hypothetical protein EDB92DRAFT_2119049 [Lactarius akahatsu]|uniref:Uncharacterized protein n=1 Tax=Lactarius akahatsu TaxID=416441 RepID=A0AAD4L5D0_9AGAM|nr:hypothetical protein EDB92DRAFT_2119049 [Lactarius akahatsu]
MHASHVAILVLAVSAASPVISAPLAARGAAATSDIVARGFSTSVFSNVNKGTRAFGARGFDLSDVKGILGTVIAGLLVRGDVDGIQARYFSLGNVKGTLDTVKNVAGLLALGARALIRPSDAKAITGTVGDIASLLARDDVDHSVLEGAFLQAISRRDVSELEARGEVSSIFQAIKDIIQVVSRRDVTPEQLIALASLPSSPLNSLD